MPNCDIRRVLGIALLPALFAQSVFGAPYYFQHVWQKEQGLPENAVTTIVQSRIGYLWLGTYSGLVRFDGVHFALFDNSNTPQLKSSRITSLYEDGEGSLWIGHETGELTRLKNGIFEAISPAQTGKARKISAIGADEQGDIWSVSVEGLMTRMRDGVRLAPPAGNAVGQLAFAVDASHHIWIARQGKLSRIEHGKCAPVVFPQESPEAYVQGVCASADGGVWISNDGKLRKWKDGKWMRDLGTAPWGLAGVGQFLELKNNYLAAGTVDSGLYLINSGQPSIQLSRTNGLPQNWIRSLCEDREGNLWVGAGSDGLVALREGKVAVIDPPGSQGRAIMSVSGRDESDMWIATEGAGLYHWKSGAWEDFGEEAGLSNLFVWSVSRDQAGRVWAGTWGGGVFVEKDGRFEHPRQLEDFRAPCQAILHGKNGVTWIGSEEGLIRYENGITAKYGEAEGLDQPQVRSLAEDRDGTLWFGMLGGGLGRVREGTLKQFRASDGLSSDFVQCIHLEEDGTIWLGTSDGGLTRMKDEKFATITREQGLADNVICDIEDDGQGQFWISSHGGIMRVSKAELNACADGKTNSVNCLTYGSGEGMRTPECRGGMQPSGCRTSDGRLWFPTSKGLVVLDPKDAKKNLVAPHVVIEEFYVDDNLEAAQVRSSGGGHRGGGKTSGQPKSNSASPADVLSAASDYLNIPAGRHRFDIFYTGLSFTVPEKVRFRFRLEGLDRDWIDRGTERFVNYSYIPPGDYTFRVIACNNDDVWSTESAAIKFRVLPLFWQTWWFRAAVAVLGAAAVAAIVLAITRHRTKRKLEQLERQRAIERERTRIAKDIHDDLGASLTRITMLSQSARTDLDHSGAASDLDRIYDTAREMTRAMDEIVWAVNPQHDTLDSLATYLGRFAQGFLASTHVRCRLDVPMQLPTWPLTAEVRHNLFLAFKEALHNAVKHSKTAEVHISVTIDAGGFTLCVEDKGCGFELDGWQRRGLDALRPGAGSGLTNMRQRLAEIGGRCEIESDPATGTTVEFVVPVKVALS